MFQYVVLLNDTLVHTIDYYFEILINSFDDVACVAIAAHEVHQAHTQLYYSLCMVACSNSVFETNL